MISNEVEVMTPNKYPEVKPLNPNAPEFVPVNRVPFSSPTNPPFFFHPPPQQPFVKIMYGCFRSFQFQSKPSFHHHSTTTLSKQKLAGHGPGSGLLPTPVTVSGNATVSSPAKKTSPSRRFRRVAGGRCGRQPVSGGVWVEKAVVESSSSSSPLPVAYYPFEDCTSLMIRNIPSRLSREELLGLLDEHCREENEKLKESPSSIKLPASEFDFLYLPIDFRRKGNLGYAFVNFTSWEGAARLFNSWRGTKWDNCTKIHTRKICQICRAKFQGREALKGHFERSVFRCESDEYLPVEIRPARNGCNSSVSNLVTIGTRVCRLQAN